VTARVRELVAWGAAELRGTDTPRLDAEVLMAFVAATRRSAVLAFPEREVPAAAEARFRDSIRRRAEGLPLSYITGRREFFSLALEVSADTLVPRPETELLVEEALARLPDGVSASVLDLGTGSGAIALAIKRARPRARVSAVDVSAAALAVARRNGEALGLDVRWLQSDWYQALDDERFDLIVANPPYVASGDGHLAGALRFEPRAALDGGADGLAAIRVIVAGAPSRLARAGHLLVEHGHDQAERVGVLMADAGLRAVASLKDLGGRPRLAVACAP
jgi:release factor glutamine methyltransferase